MAQPTEITEKMMTIQTIFLNNVTSIEVTEKPFWSEGVRCNQIRIVIECNDGRNRMESEMFLIANDDTEITWYGKNMEDVLAENKGE